jgi:hypothetical protein
MYGSHYSSAGVVLHYLVRALPYSQLAVDLQGGRFDVPDRLFLGIEAAWRSTTNSMTDVKEVIPELYYAPEVLCNMNSLPLGKSQSGVLVDDVLLPAWCLNDPLQFIRVHRAALESDRVSDTLHLWIDLIFGDAQQGPKAVERANVFYHLTYEGAVNVEDIEDESEREATDAQIARSQRPAVLRCLHAIDATRVRQTRSWVVSFSILRPCGPRRATAMLRAGALRPDPTEVIRESTPSSEACPRMCFAVVLGRAVAWRVSGRVVSRVRAR